MTIPDSAIRLTFPASCTELPTEIARLSCRTETVAVAFANTYGLLTTRGVEEPLRSIWAHAERMHYLLELARGPRVSKLTTLLGDVHRLESRAAAASARVGWRRLLAQELSKALRWLRMEIHADEERGRFYRVYDYQRLVDVAYWQVAQTLIGGQGFRRCEECQRIFIVNHGRRTTCPPRVDERGRDGYGESRCASRLRKRRQRPKQR